MKSLPNNWITPGCRLVLADQEAVDNITRILAENQATLALRFWVKLGYDRITKISGDRSFALDAFANLELGKRL